MNSYSAPGTVSVSQSAPWKAPVFGPWGWLYWGFNGGLHPRVLCSCSGVHPDDGLQPVPVNDPDAWPELCPMCDNHGIHPVPYTEMLNESNYNQLDKYLR